MSVVLHRLLRTERARIALVAAGIVLWMVLLMVVYKQLGAQVFKGAQSSSTFSRGFDIRAFTNSQSVFANLVGIAFTHPLFLAMMGSVGIGLGARSCAGELASGTLESALAGPLSRRSHLLAYVVFMDVALALLIALAAVTVLVGAPLVHTSGRIDTVPMLEVALQAWLLYASFAALAVLLSTIVRSRSAALTGGLVLLVGSYFVEFFARLWDTISVLGYLSPFHYFTPTGTLLGDGLSWGDCLVLAAVSIVATAAAVWQFERRDLAP